MGKWESTTHRRIGSTPTASQAGGRSRIGQLRDEGVWNSHAGDRSETLVGAISPNNQGGVMLDDDGQHPFTIREHTRRLL
jgi:hypothetical protein